MAGYRYEITVKPLEDRKGQLIDKPALVFEVSNHDEILSIVEKIRSRSDLDFPDEQKTAFAVGLKLFSEIMIEHRKHPIFAPLRDAFKNFMMGLKKGNGGKNDG
ncbi:DUF3861 domain-containing protein [Celerinatantimonas sp. MCCC 1A17872]|uniref:DUF3861 domain-containing protein n=1 Tax=Celerinatantimonas sp. MCCC 1A17872 TaxID=3177514 RepID=UPI0038BFBF36